MRMMLMKERIMIMKDGMKLMMSCRRPVTGWMMVRLMMMMMMMVMMTKQAYRLRGIRMTLLWMKVLPTRLLLPLTPSRTLVANDPLVHLCMCVCVCMLCVRVCVCVSGAVILRPGNRSCGRPRASACSRRLPQ